MDASGTVSVLAGQGSARPQGIAGAKANGSVKGTVLAQVESRTDGLGFLAGGGQTGALIRAHDWAASPLGPPQDWPPALKTAAGLMLGARQPVYVAWGPELTSLYNDAYLPIVGTKHPDGLGQPFRELWAEIWDDFRPIIEATLAGEAQHFTDLPIALAGRPDVPLGYFTFSYTALHGDDGRPAGFYCAATETTAQLLAERCRAFLLTLSEALAPMSDVAAIEFTACRLLAEHLGADRVYYSEIDEDTARARVNRDFAAPGLASFVGGYDLADLGWSLAIYRSGASLVIDDTAASPLVPPASKAMMAHFGIGACICVPLIKDAVLIGVLVAASTAPRRWREEEAGLVRDAGDRLWPVTQRARAEAALRERGLDLLEAQRLGRIGSWRWTAATDTTTGSDELFRIYGLDPATDSLPPFAAMRGSLYTIESWDRLDAAITDAWQTGQNFALDLQVLRGGAPFWVTTRIEVLHGPDGAPTGLRGTLLDISARREAELALARSEEQLRLATEAGAIGQWDVDVVNDTLFWAPIVQAMFGISPGVPVTMADYYNGLHPDDFDATAAAYAAACDPARRALYDVEYRTIGKEDGIVRWVAARGRGIFDDAGVCTRVIGTAIDITRRRETEALLQGSAAALQVERAFLHEVLAKAPIGFSIADRAGAITIVNDRGAELLGHRHLTAEPGDYTGYGAIHADGRPYAPEDYPTLRAAAGERIERERMIYRRGGPGGAETMVLQIDAVPIHDAAGTIAGAVTVFEDAGVQERAEQEAQRRIAEAVAELETAQEALRQSQKLESMGQLTGGVAHDFNNLLTPIVGALDMLQRQRLGGEREQRLIAGAVQSAERAAVLVQRLLAFARRQPLQPGAIDAGALVTGMADIIRSTSGPQIKVVVEVDQALPPAIADANQLEMALLNLSVNARDAMPDGGTLRITATRAKIGPGHPSQLRPGAWIRLSVADTGTGMDAAVLARAVEPFFSTKGIGKGTGLGLSMAHGLASQLGGALTLQSHPGVGTNAELWLPISADAPPDADGDAMAGPADLDVSAGTVLLVDDEELVRLSTADMLTSLGYTVVEAASAEDALRLIAAGLAPEILVTDHLMPGMTGTDLARQVRREHPDTRVLLISGYTDGEGIAPDLPRLAKPFRSADLAVLLAASHA